MPADRLPSSDDLSSAEVDEILDPLSTGVPELSPLNTIRRRSADLEERVSQSDGEEKLVATAELARCLSLVEPHRATELVDEVLEIAGPHDWLRAQAEAHRAHASLPWFILGIDREEWLNWVLTGIQLFDHLGSPLRKAELMGRHSFHQWQSNGGARRAAEETWQARQLALDPQCADDERLRHTILGVADLMFARIALHSERSDEHSRRYAALAILHLRLSESPVVTGVVHTEVAAVSGHRSDLAGAREHHLRAARIFRHNEAWNQCLLSMQRATYKQVQMDDMEGAYRSLSNLKKLRSAKSVHGNVFSVEITEGYIRLHEENWNDAITALEPLLDLEAVTRETIVMLLRDLSKAYQKIGNGGKAMELLQRAISVQEQLYEDRLQGQAHQFSLSDEILHLKEKTQRDDALLKAILPPSAYAEVERNGRCEARIFERVAVLYTDFANFTAIASGIPPRQLMETLGEIYDEFDRRMAKHGCERIEVIGDAYLAVAGLDTAEDPVPRMARAALDVSAYLSERNRRDGSVGGPVFVARIGLHVGSIIGGLVGSDRLRYAIFGDAVNTAQRLEAGGNPGEVTVSEAVAETLRLCDGVSLQSREGIEAKGKGMLPAWILCGA